MQSWNNIVLSNITEFRHNFCKFYEILPEKNRKEILKNSLYIQIRLLCTSWTSTKQTLREIFHSSQTLNFLKLQFKSKRGGGRKIICSVLVNTVTLA